ncbi:MAG: histidine--tRNA ligase [Candidatus Eremiobacteraeota bacterium]|nr:histidine--tRNA ligase [Candidatus Eremiobacteraeota bacterium]
MSKRIKPRLMKGMRDFLPDDMIKRNYVIDTVKRVFETHGFLPLETPTIEMWEVLSGKYGDDGEKLIYRFGDKGGRDLGLRYDLTIPLSRVVAMYQHRIVRPFKRYQIQPVWRADKPGKGRYREFYQCDVDVVGSADILADAEVIQVSYEIMKSLGFHNFVIKINTRKILRGIVELSGVGVEMEAQICRSIDKLDKIGMEGVEEELLKRGISQEAKDKIIDYISIKGTPHMVILQAHTKLGGSEIALEGVEELSLLRKYLEYMGINEENISFDLALSRGLDYYTGPIFETVVEKPKIGSVTGGGRFDNLIGQYMGMDVPATGNSIGLERIITVMDELNMYPDDLAYSTKVLICRFDDEDMEYTLKLAERLRKTGFNTEVYMGKSKLRGQLGYAADRNIPVIVIAGGDERAKGLLTLKNMQNREQTVIDEKNVCEEIQKILG